jgi:hypothetical protein
LLSLYWTGYGDQKQHAQYETRTGNAVPSLYQLVGHFRTIRNFPGKFRWHFIANFDPLFLLSTASSEISYGFPL